MRLTINGFNQFTKDNKYGNGYKITIDIGYISNVTSRNVDVGAICDIYIVKTRLQFHFIHEVSLLQPR